MGRIPASDLERVKRDTDLAELVRGSGVDLDRRGGDLVGLCPFHDDRDPSLVVTPAKGLWHCLGACQTGGSVIDWVMKRDGVSFREAAELLMGGAPVASEPAPALALDPDASDAELLSRVVEHYHDTLLKTPEAKAYLKTRGLGDPDLIETFELGYANRTLGRCLPPSKHAEGERIRSRLQEVGVLRKSGHEHLMGSLVIPLRDESGEVVQLYGRKLRDDLRKGTPTHLYLPGPLRGVWNERALEAHREMILCESLIDALTFWSAGYRNVTSAFGTNGFTDELFGALQSDRVKRILIAFDRDEAGDRASKKVARKLQGAGMECYRIQFPRGMDANEYAREVKPANKSLGVTIRGATWMGLGNGNGPSAQESEDRDASPPISESRAVAQERAVEDPAPEPTEAANDNTKSSSLAASPVPAAASLPTVPLQVTDDEVTATVEDRSYRVRGLEKNLSPDLMKVNLLVRRGETVHVDTLDLYQARQRTAFVAQASGELEASKKSLTRDLGRLLLSLERLQAERIRKALEPDDAKEPELTAVEKRDAMSLLKDPDLLGRILKDFERAGVVGEETNKLVGYLAAVSRKLDEPLAIVIQSSSAAGKTALMDAVLSFVPPEDRVQYSALTGQSLFYMEPGRLKHRVLAVVEEAGAERASYALKLLQSEGELTIASTGKDPDTGKLVTNEYRVEGPVMLFLTTTAVEVDEELMNRALVLAVDEDRSQTRRVHRAQRERRTLDGLLGRKHRDHVVTVHRNAQRLLRRLQVVNPYAPELTFIDTRTRTRRDHGKYLTLIDAVALLHQYQREVKTAERGGIKVEYVEVEPRDIAIANRLAGEVLGRSLDELPPQTRRVLEQLRDRAQDSSEVEASIEPDHKHDRDHDHDDDRDHHERSRFTAREVREALGLGPTQTKIHLSRLVELEYLAAHRRGPGLPYVYELLYRGEGETGTPFLPGLLDVSDLADVTDPAELVQLAQLSELDRDENYDLNRSGVEGGWSGQNEGWSGGGRPLAGGWSGGGRTALNPENAITDAAFGPGEPSEPEIAYRGDEPRSYVLPGRNGTRP